ncbi:MAG: hypothetical protein AB7U20_09245 [Planctomycetaceae bacterium]
MSPRVLLSAVCFAALLGRSADCQSAKPLRFDMGSAQSPVAAGFTQVTEQSAYSPQRGFGWETRGARPAVWDDLADIRQFELYDFMMAQFDDLNRDAVVSEDELVFRADVPNGTYRVAVVVGDMSQAIGSMDLTINGKLVARNLDAWSPGSRGAGNHRRLMMEPYGWWHAVHASVDVRDGAVRIKLSKDQQFFDEMLAKQSREEPAWEKAIAEEYEDVLPYKRIGVDEPIYYYIGWPFVHNSLMAVEIVADVPIPLANAQSAGQDARLTLTQDVNSPQLTAAIEQFNAGDYHSALSSISGIDKPDALPVKAVLALWLAGRLETEFAEDARLVQSAIDILEPYVAAHPDQVQLAELLDDAKQFQRAYQIHVNRGHDPYGENHFYENVKAIAHWWNIPPSSPLYDQTRLHIARAEHMLHPYMPARGTYREIFKQLEQKYPDNRFVKYHLHETWKPHGDGSHYYDWIIPDHSAEVQDAPEWVREAYLAFQTVLDWSEWWIKYKQLPSGTIGGGWGDDVEIVGVFGYYGYTGRDVSEMLVDGTNRIMEGLWYNSEIDPELGFCLPFTDAEHAAEWTGNTLGMMTVIDYGNPVWIERSMKTGKLLRDLWTAPNDHGHRHFRANYFCATHVGTGAQMNDSWINYRAIRPALAVLRYNRNPTIARLVTELADGWLAAAMSTDRGKPRGVIPTEIAFPSGLIGGVKSPSWFEAHNDPRTGNESFTGQGYKPYVVDLLYDAFTVSGDAKYLEPLRLEHELAQQHGFLPASKSGLRLQRVREPIAFGSRKYQPVVLEGGETKPRNYGDKLKPGSAEWTAYHLGMPDEWLIAQKKIEGRRGKLQNDITKADILRASHAIRSEYAWRWPLHTTEASPTDRIGIGGMVNPFIIYTGGRIGGPLLEAAVTYENTTRRFAAAVMANDPQGLRILYHSLTDGAREISLVPWKLESGCRYKLTYGPDADDDEQMDSVSETREFDFPQIGTPLPVTVEPRVTYLIEIDQVSRTRAAALAPDPAITSSDLRHDWGTIIARVHNIGSAPVHNLEVAAFDGDPKQGGTLINKAVLPHIEAPIDLDPKTAAIGIPWNPQDDQPHDIHIVLDPENKLTGEITNFNNTASAPLPAPKPSDDTKTQRMPTGGRRADRL